MSMLRLGDLQARYRKNITSDSDLYDFRFESQKIPFIKNNAGKLLNHAISCADKLLLLHAVHNKLFAMGYWQAYDGILKVTSCYPPI